MVPQNSPAPQTPHSTLHSSDPPHLTLPPTTITWPPRHVPRALTGDSHMPVGFPLIDHIQNLLGAGNEALGAALGEQGGGGG